MWYVEAVIIEDLQRKLFGAYQSRFGATCLRVYTSVNGDVQTDAHMHAQRRWLLYTQVVHALIIIAVRLVPRAITASRAWRPDCRTLLSPPAIEICRSSRLAGRCRRSKIVHFTITRRLGLQRRGRCQTHFLSLLLFIQLTDLSAYCVCDVCASRWRSECTDPILYVEKLPWLVKSLISWRYPSMREQWTMRVIIGRLKGSTIGLHVIKF